MMEGAKKKGQKRRGMRTWNGFSSGEGLQIFRIFSAGKGSLAPSTSRPRTGRRRRRRRIPMQGRRDPTLPPTLPPPPRLPPPALLVLLQVLW